MYNNIIFQNEFISIAENEGHVYISIKKPGFEASRFSEVTAKCPRLKLTNFVAFNSALKNQLNAFVEIGVYKDIIEISTSKDRFEAYATVNLNDQDYNSLEKDDIVDLIIARAKKEGIRNGLDVVFIVDHLVARQAFVIAKGTKPIQGDDAVIKLYEIEEAKPELVEDGTVNHYELNLINKVEQGDWLGERVEPTDGFPGRTVFGEIVKALPGKQERLIYDRKTVKATLDKSLGLTLLTAKRVGAVVYENGVLTVCNYLEISGKVSFETGNIDFDGFVDIKDTVDDNFSVVANQDIQIMGSLGVGAVEFIESREGSIYIRGGIAGQEKAEIICDGDLYTKFAADCKIICNGTVHIGYYTMNANIKAKEVILESANSRIIGGSIDADIRVKAGEIGSKAEVPTKIKVHGFDRQAMREEYDNLGATIDKLNQMGQLLKQKISIFQNSETDDLSDEEVKEYEKMENEYVRCQKSLKVYIQRKKNYVGYLHAKGEGEINAAKRMHPNVSICMRRDEFINTDLKNVGVCYYLKGDEIISDM